MRKFGFLRIASLSPTLEVWQHATASAVSAIVQNDDEKDMHNVFVQLNDKNTWSGVEFELQNALNMAWPAGTDKPGYLSIPTNATY